MLHESEKSSIFNLSVDGDMQYNLKEIAKWARFLAVVGFVSLGFILIAIIALLITSIGYGSNSTIQLVLVYIVAAGLYFYPVVTLFKFGKGMKLALIQNDQHKMNNAIRNLKSCFQYLGIITIILLVIYGIVLIYFLIIASTNF